MKESKLYYTPPKDKSFDELRHICTRYWKCFDDSHGYATNKIHHINNLKNIGGNFIEMVKMIHPVARIVIAEQLSIDCRNDISIRLESGGESELTDCFNIYTKKY